MATILGIDPGSRVTGYGLIESQGTRERYLASGAIRMRDTPLPERLATIFDGVGELIARHHPAELAIERVFMHRNAASALILGHARGAALLAGVRGRLPIHEYTPAEVKQAVTGNGRAAKGQVQEMVMLLLRLVERPGEDAADALAVALCHGRLRTTLARIPDARGQRGGRLR